MQELFIRMADALKGSCGVALALSIPVLLSVWSAYLDYAREARAQNEDNNPKETE